MLLLAGIRGTPSLSLSLLVPNGSFVCLSLNDCKSFSTKPISRISVRNNGFRSVSRDCSPKPIEEHMTDSDTSMKQKIESLGIDVDSCIPGLFDLLFCPKCNGGELTQRTLSFHISQNWNSALWRCFHLKCGWAGQVIADNKKSYPSVSLRGKINSSRPLTVENLRLEMLGDELLTYFAERRISKETLQRNNVMQVTGRQKIIAFPYRRDEILVGCKYRTIEKRFWQEKDTEKMLYGLDDIREANEIIIVEGEIDKLSMEEAGFYNCVSVPSGAPQTISLKEVPSLEKDTSYQYLWNCKDYLDKVGGVDASRIILATDGDAPGQALAEELCRRLGRERCWQVHWPKKDEFSCFKDANEVLRYLGADALRDAVVKAKLCAIPNSN